MKKYISVFIPTYNGEKYIRESIDSILRQTLPKGYNLEILVTDSGSKDGTIDILRSYKNSISLLEIPNSEFGHGKTRQQAALRAQGEFILFLSQDATPYDDSWIINMIEPFYLSDRVGCVFGRQIPRQDAVVTIKREVATVFGRLGAPDALTIHRHQSLVDKHPTNELNSFFSDVNSAIRKKLITTVPFRDVAYAEDQALAADMQNSGYLKAYSVLGAVWHSNEYSVHDFYKRKFDEYIGLQESIGYQLSPSVKSLLLGWVRPTLGDWRFALNDGAYGRKRKVKNLLMSIGYNYMSGLGKYHAAKYINDPVRRARISLEKSRSTH